MYIISNFSISTLPPLITISINAVPTQSVASEEAASTLCKK